ncbi:MAG TPA: protein tyrosine phosphatase family protein [Vicinamibacterales bacterium]|nr:protein tyrosine phosphatase family protein [Vicinamibacterales bacterium]
MSALILVAGLTAVTRASQAGATPAAQELPPIRNFLQVTPEFCTGGQPRVEHFAKLKADGVKSVLNLRTPGEHRAEEEQAAVVKAGLKYFNIPFVYTAPSDAQVDEFLRLTDDPANRPMFIHCTAAIRVGAFWTIRRALRDGMPVDAALEEGRKIGLVNAPHLEEFARNYIAAKKKI